MRSYRLGTGISTWNVIDDQAQGKAYPAAFTSDRYAAQIAADGTVNLYRRNQWSWARLGSAVAGIASGPSYTLQLGKRDRSTRRWPPARERCALRRAVGRA